MYMILVCMHTQAIPTKMQLSVASASLAQLSTEMVQQRSYDCCCRKRQSASRQVSVCAS